MHPMDLDSAPATYSKEFSMLESAGASSVRFDVYWNAVEWTAHGEYDGPTLARLDAVFASARAHRLKVILDVWSTPCWASSAPVSVTLGCGFGWWNNPVNRYPPVAASDYANFAVFVAQRWGADLAALELWNEPNGTDLGFLISTDQAADYARLVRAAYPAVKAVDPSLPVIMSLAGTDTTFLAELYADGVRGFYDGIAVHPYGDPVLSGLKAFRVYQVSQGDTKQLWVTEVGWPSNTVGEQGQAQNLTGTLGQLAALPYVAAAEIYDMHDKGSSSDPQDHFGLLDYGLNPKPAWSAFVAALKATPTPAVSTLPASNPAPAVMTSTTAAGTKHRHQGRQRHKRRRRRRRR